MKTDAQPVTLDADNLSIGWGKVMLALARRGVNAPDP